MVDKLHEYEGLAGRAHGIKDSLKEKWDSCKQWKDGIPTDQGIAGFLNYLRGPPKLERAVEDYAHVYRSLKKAFFQLLQIKNKIFTERKCSFEGLI